MKKLADGLKISGAYDLTARLAQRRVPALALAKHGYATSAAKVQTTRSSEGSMDRLSRFGDWRIV